MYFTTYEVVKKLLTPTKSSDSGILNGGPFMVHFAAGLLAEMVSCIFWVPIGTFPSYGSLNEVLMMLFVDLNNRRHQRTSTSAIYYAHTGPCCLPRKSGCCSYYPTIGRLTRYK